MKKLLFALLLFCTSLQVSFAQLFFGANAGFNNSTVRLSDGYKNEYIQYYYLSQGAKITGNYLTQSNIGAQAGLHIGYSMFNEKFALILAPGYSSRNFGFTTEDVVTEIVEVQSTGDLDIREGYRDWSISNVSSINIPLLAKVNFGIGGDRFGVSAMVGLSYNLIQKGKYSTNFNVEGEDPIAGNPEFILRSDGNGNPIALGPFDYDEYPQDGKPLKFGSGAFDHYSKKYTSFILSPGLFFKLDPDGKIRLTLDWRWDIGLNDMYTTNRKSQLEKSDVNIKGTQKFNSGMLNIGVSFCPSCGF